LTCKEVELVLPIASHTKRAGSFINVDGYVQHSPCAIKNEHGHKALLEILQEIIGDAIASCKDVWEAELFFYEVLRDISFDTLKNSPKIAL